MARYGRIEKWSSRAECFDGSGTQPRQIVMKMQSDGISTPLKDGEVEAVAIEAENERLKRLVVELTAIILRNVAERK